MGQATARTEALRELAAAAEELVDRDDGQAWSRLKAAVDQWRRVKGEQMAIGGVG